tara:strand:- start:1524 stop:1904 length:381 start_codon:yes stop_codon:yes gene_type:complete
MARQRTPLVKAQATGQADKHPERFKDRVQPKSKSLGPPSAYMTKFEKLAWKAFKKEYPWLQESDRAHLEIACSLRARLLEGKDVGIAALNGLRSCIAQMGGNPVDRSKVMVEDEKDKENAIEAYFH